MINLVDTLAPMGSFEVAKAKDIRFDDNESLQKKLDDGSLGGGSSTFVGTQADWEALLPTEKAKYEFVDFTNDVDGALIDDTEAHSNKVYSSSKVEDLIDDNKIKKITKTVSSTDAISYTTLGARGVQYSYPLTDIASGLNGERVVGLTITNIEDSTIHQVAPFVYNDKLYVNFYVAKTTSIPKNTKLCEIRIAYI